MQEILSMLAFAMFVLIVAALVNVEGLIHNWHLLVGCL